MLIDTHSHINDEKLADSLEEILKNLSTGRVGGVICPSYSLDSSKTSLIVAQNDRVWAALGVHPENCTQYDATTKRWLDKALSNPKVVAVGEIGIDYHYGKENVAKQKQVLLSQVELAHKHDLPVIFHMRDAWEDCLLFLKNHKDIIKRGVVHCFDGDANVAQKIVDLGYYISVTGLITYPKNAKVREAVKIIPHERLMVETDAPYLAPQKYRGKINRPEYVAEVADMVASIWGIGSEEVDRITTQNAKRFFELEV